MHNSKYYLSQLSRLSRWGKRRLYPILQTKWVYGWMRLGHASKGFLYGLIGFFAMRAVIHDAKSAGGSKAVLATLDNVAFGRLVLAVLAVGLVGYSLWRFIQMGINPEHPHKSLGLQQFMQRCGYGFSGLTYLSVGYTAGRLVIGLTVDFENTVEEIAEVLFEIPIGSWALFASGLSVICIGLAYIYGAFSGSFISEFQPQLYTAVRHSTVLMGKIGFTARGVSFMLIGAYLVKSAYLTDDDEAGGLGDILDRLDDQPFGKIWLTAIACGFFAYAAYMMMSALYRKLPELDAEK